MLQWRPHLDPFWTGTLILALAAWMAVLYRRLVARFSRRRAVLLLLPKGLLLLLLVLGLFEPVVRRQERADGGGRLLAVVDVSHSMEIADDGRTPRRERARLLVEALRKALPAEVPLDLEEFDTGLRETTDAALRRARGGAGLHDTDLGGCLATLASRADASSCAGILLFTDGGDELLGRPELPAVPVSIVGIGTDPAGWDDVAVESVEAPPTAEKDIAFEIAAALRARAANPAFLAGLDRLALRLETEQPDGAWKRLDERPVDLTRGIATVRFRIEAPEPGLQRYRVVLPAVTGELSGLNNARTFTVEVRKKAIHVLYFTRELGMDFKMIREELARDPGVAFTGLFRTIGERFTVQGDAGVDGEALARGFPAEDEVLRGFDVIILGSFPAADWSPGQMLALVRRVEAGGAVVFLGGDQSFGLGGYAGTPLAPLFPWTLSAGEPPLSIGEFPVNIPPPVASQPIVAGLSSLLATEAPQLESANHPGPLKAGATALVNVTVDQQVVPVVALQSYGRGKALGIAANTLWRWSRRNETMRDAYGRFWRQAIRYLAGSAEGGQVLSVQWDQEAYRPGEQGIAEIRATAPKAGEPLRLAASLTGPAGAAPVPVTPVSGLADTWRARVPFGERGDYTFRLSALRGDATIESYEKRFRVAALLPEGAHLAVDDAFLTDLAARTGGRYWPERDANAFLREMSGGEWRKTATVEKPLLQSGPGLLILFLALLMLEWVLRRMMNLF